MRWCAGLACLVLGLTNVWAADSESVSSDLKTSLKSPPGAMLQFDNIGHEGGFTLSGLDARLQLVVSQQSAGRLRSDMTHEVTYRVDQPAVVQVTDGMVVPLQDGEAMITAENTNGQTDDFNVIIKHTVNKCFPNIDSYINDVKEEINDNSKNNSNRIKGSPI